LISRPTSAFLSQARIPPFLLLYTLEINPLTRLPPSAHPSLPCPSTLYSPHYSSGSGAKSLEIVNCFHSLIGTGISKLRKRAGDSSLTSTTGESCLSLQNVPFYYNAITANWHAADGTKGNTISGDYVLLDGREENLHSGPMPLPGDGAATGALAGMMVTATRGSTSVSMTATTTTEKATGEGTGAATGGRIGVGVNGGTQSDTTATAAAGNSGSARPMMDGLLMELLVVCGVVVIGTGLLFSA
jgi:hypothetical protein